MGRYVGEFNFEVDGCRGRGTKGRAVVCTGYTQARGIYLHIISLGRIGKSRQVPYEYIISLLFTPSYHAVICNAHSKV